MKIAIMGSGGLGGYYGGKLARAGNEVAFVARGAHLEAMRKSGLRVETTADAFTIQPVRAVAHPSEIGPTELVLMTVKAYALEDAARSILPLVGPETAVIPLLNGVDAAERIGRVVGMEHLLGGLAYVSSSIVEPGLVRQVSPFDKIVFGELPGGLSERGTRIEATMRDAGIEAAQSDNIARELWSKFLFIDAASGVCALTGTTMGPVLGDPDTRELFVGCMREVEALARKLEIDLPENVVAETLAFADKAPGHMKPSMLLDLEQGRALELEALNGTAARLGRELGVETPVNAFIHAALKLRADGRG